MPAVDRLYQSQAFQDARSNLLLADQWGSEDTWLIVSHAVTGKLDQAAESEWCMLHAHVQGPVVD